MAPVKRRSETLKQLMPDMAKGHPGVSQPPDPITVSTALPEAATRIQPMPESHPQLMPDMLTGHPGISPVQTRRFIQLPSRQKLRPRFSSSGLVFSRGIAPRNGSLRSALFPLRNTPAKDLLAGGGFYLAVANERMLVTAWLSPQSLSEVTMSFFFHGTAQHACRTTFFYRPIFW